MKHTELEIETTQSGDAGSFWTGVMVGLVAGACGFMVLEEKEGAQFREKAKQLWQSAKKQAAHPSEGIGWKEGVATFVDSLFPPEKKISKAVRTSRKPVKKAQPTRFKGT